MLIERNWSFETKGFAAQFDRHVREQLPFYDLATDALSVVARHYVPRDGVVYDLGCSTGNVGRAMAPVLDDRAAKLIPVDESEAMREAYSGPQRGNFVVANLLDLEFEPFDLAVLFLTMMFVEKPARATLLDKLLASCRPGGAVVIVDKTVPAAGYPATVMWRMVLSAKAAAKVDPAEIVAKELSLGGVQRPVEPDLFLSRGAVEWFRYGDFAGWLLERP